jgi:fructose-1,6-bisphosphatase/sedoheptulose 1,7-bisphosphatase-like protein
LERLLALEMIRVTKAAAIASARLMGRGDTMDADRIAVEAMRRTFDEIPIDARIVIGEGSATRPLTPSAANRECPP